MSLACRLCRPSGIERQPCSCLIDCQSPKCRPERGDLTGSFLTGAGPRPPSIPTQPAGGSQHQRLKKARADLAQQAVR